MVRWLAITLEPANLANAPACPGVGTGVEYNDLRGFRAQDLPTAQDE